MNSLTQYELEKTGRKKEFLLSMALLLAVNLFLLLVTELPDEMTPPLSAYRTFQQEISGLTEQEKAACMESWKETLDHMAFVQEVLSIRNLSGEMGEYFLKQTLESRPGEFEKYYESFQKGDYLRFTDSFYLESALAEELYGEWQAVSGYGDYLVSVQENKEILEGIGIFSAGNAGQGKDGFSSRNISKSAADYGKLSGISVSWIPGKPLVRAMESTWTDLLLLLSVFLFAGNLIFLEKERKLLFITRSTRRGIYPCILSKLAALFLHCLFMVFLLYGANLLFYGITAGLGSMEGFWKASLQSIAEYRESALPVTTGQFVLLCLLTKGIVLFGIAAVLTALCIFADNIFFPYGAVGLLYGAGWILYRFVPAGTRFAALKYLNPAGMMKTENLYGRYLNINVLGYPVSRTGLSFILTALLGFGGIALCLLFYGQGRNLSLREKPFSSPLFRKKSGVSKSAFRSKILYRTGLWGHEWYKIMIAGRAMPIMLVFLLFIGYHELTREYGISVKEQYYQDLCLSLEGELTPDKEAAVLAEEARFREAFDNISRIEEMVSEGKITSAAGEDLKSEWYAVTAFYPSFQRIWQQYLRILESGGYFIYDTGYLYLFGPQNTNFTVNLLLLSICCVFAFGNCFAQEYKSGAWRLLNASSQGKNKVLIRKVKICLLTMAVAASVPFLSRAVNVSAVFPLHGLGFPADNIPYCSNMPSWMPVAVFLLLSVMSQAASLVLVTMGVCLLSCWRRDSIQTVFFALLLFALPLTLKLLGFAFAGWFSVYPLYAWTTLL